MLIGMTVPPVGRDNDKTSGRRLRRVADTPSGEANDSAGDATEHVHEAEARPLEMNDNGEGVGGRTKPAPGYTPDPVRRAAQLEQRSYRHVQRERHKTAEARGMAAEAHHRAARLHDQQAELGWGDVEEHREQAHEHRGEAEADSAGTDRDQSAYRHHPSGRPMPPAGPDEDQLT
jgi:hypothetical protein